MHPRDSANGRRMCASLISACISSIVAPHAPPNLGKVVQWRMAAQEQGLNHRGSDPRPVPGLPMVGKAQADAAAAAGVKMFVFSTLEDVDERSKVHAEPESCVSSQVATRALPYCCRVRLTRDSEDSAHERRKMSASEAAQLGDFGILADLSVLKLGLTSPAVLSMYASAIPLHRLA